MLSWDGLNIRNVLINRAVCECLCKVDAVLIKRKKGVEEKTVQVRLTTVTHVGKCGMLQTRTTAYLEKETLSS